MLLNNLTLFKFGQSHLYSTSKQWPIPPVCSDSWPPHHFGWFISVEIFCFVPSVVEWNALSRWNENPQCQTTTTHYEITSFVTKGESTPPWRLHFHPCPFILYVCWLVDWFVSKITHKLPNGYPLNLDGVWVSMKNRPLLFLVGIWIKGRVQELGVSTFTIFFYTCKLGF